MTGLLTVSNLFAWSAQVAILVAVALYALHLARLEAPAARHALLRVVLAVCLALPFIQPHRVLPDAVSGRVETAFLVTTAAAPSGAGASPEDAVGSRSSWTIAFVLLAGVLIRLTGIGAGVVRLRRLRRVGEMAPPDSEHEQIQALIGTRATIRYVRGLGQPVTFGFRRPVVLLPQSLRELPQAIRRAVLAHELWHVRRRDWPWTVVEEAIRAMFWFHPAVWILLSRIQATREEVVDELTVLATGSRRSYLDALIAYADESPLFAATAFARRRHLVQRMILISQEAAMSARRVVATCAMFMIALALSGWYAVGAFPLVQAPSDAIWSEPGPLELQARPVTPENPVPRRTRHVVPHYPTEAEVLGARGVYTLRATLDQSGRVAEARVVGLTFNIKNRVGMSFRSSSQADFDRALQATVRGYPGGGSEALASYRSALEAMAQAARRAVTQWTYDPPAEGPIAFEVQVAFGAPPVPPPPPPGPAVSSRPGMPPPPPPAAPRDTQTQTGSWQAYEGAIRVGGNVKPPTKIKNVNPVYPPDAMTQRVQGVIIIEARIEPDGTVGHARILRSIPMLDEAALEAVRQWEFTPTLLNGNPVPVIMTVTVNFTMQ